MDSYSLENVSAVLLQFEWGTDMLTALDAVRNNMAQAALTLPDGAQTPWWCRSTPTTSP